ncbi:MAG TPA: L,D-transpeptidase [Thermoleophilaceae bacterium]|nr:L,D-transpeptidase [Thermoleophilaceae bacterium]
MLALAALFAMSYAASARQREAVRAAQPGADPASGAQPAPAPTPALPAAAPATPTEKPKPARPRGIHRIAVVDASVPLRARPNGRVLARAGASTEFGGRRVLSVAARHGSWLGVVATEMPNGQLAWVNRRNPALHLRRTAYSLHADLSGRWLELRRHGRRIRRITVAVGRPGSETPTGRFAVTDKLNGRSFGSYYGCCVLALNGHQPKLPAGWSGGDRLAIHGTNSPSSIGAAASAGCLRAVDADLEVLMRRVPLGTPVFIRN